jgi:hypothetical protein
MVNFLAWCTEDPAAVSLLSFRSQNSSVGMATGYRLNGRVLIPGRGKIFFFFPQLPDPPILLSIGYGWGALSPWGKVART